MSKFYCRGNELVNEIQVQQGQTTRLIKNGHTCLGLSTPAGLSLTASDRHNSTVWSCPPYGEGQRHSWSPWGNGRLLAGLPGFNGERPDPVSGTYHLGNGYRTYNPVLMRFNCPDSLSPFGIGGINPYAYCSGDPVNHTDPTGHMSWQGIVGIVAGTLGLLLAGLSGGISIAATGGVMAALSAASTVTLVSGGLGVVADATAIASGATEDSDPSASAVLGWVSMATGLAGMVAGIGPLAYGGIKKGGAFVGSWQYRLQHAGGKPSRLTRQPVSIEPALEEGFRRAGVQPERYAKLRETLSAAAAAPVPETLFRGDSYPLQTIMAGEGSLDDRMVIALRHSGRQSGLGGEIQSFSGSPFAAEKFARARPGATIYSIDTTVDGRVFRSTAWILDQHAQRLVNERRILAGTVAQTVKYYLEGTEREYFWLITTTPPQ